MVRILLTCIFKNDSEADDVKRMLGSFMPYMDGLVCAITGVTGKHDKLVKIIKSFGGKYIITTPKSHPEIYAKVGGKWIFASFSAARNAVYQLADKQKGFDYYSWADADDILYGGENLQEVAETALKKKIDAVFFTYWYSMRFNPDGTYNETNVEIDQVRERLVRPGYFKWTSRLHEINLPKDDNWKPTISDWKFEKGRKNVVWVHMMDTEHSWSASKRNLQILNIQIEEEKWKDPRTIAYMARTLYDLNTPESNDQAIDLIENKYLLMSGWEEDRSMMWNYLGRIYRRKGDHKMAAECFNSAISEYPQRITNYLDLATEYFDLERFDKADFWVNQVLHMEPPKSGTIMNNLAEAMFVASGIKVNLALKRNDINEAIKWAKTQDDVGREPVNTELLKTLEDAKLYNDIGIAIFNLAGYLKEKGYKNRIKNLLEIVPPEYGGEPFLYKIANEVVEPRVWGEKTIVYYASAGVSAPDRWSPKSLKEGLGGSETAVVELARRWVKKGYDVTVYCDCAEDAGLYDGVVYRPYWEVNWNDTYNILILWRSPHLLSMDIHAKKLWMDLHDICSNLDWPEDRVKKIDKVFFKSKYQRSMIPNIPDEKCCVISNGISLGYF
jgi:tetratricopeptide (TPR) repeat protein